MKHLLKLMDLSSEEIIDILNLADQLKYEKKHGIEHHLLKGKTLGMIFRKSSTRTRVSFEVGMFDLGGTALFLSSNDLQIGRGEPAEDTARVLSRYLDGIMIRTFEQSEVETLASMGSIPIVNGLTDYCHPCQVLADLMTIREHKGSIAGNKLCFIGDGNNMANSLIVGGIKTGMKVAVACPKDHQPDAEIMKWAKENGEFLCTDDLMEAAKIDGANYLQSLFRITIPLIKDTLATNFMIITLGTLGTTGLIYGLTGGGPGNTSTTLSILMYKKSFVSFQIGYGMAISLIILVLGIVLSLVYTKLLNRKEKLQKL